MRVARSLLNGVGPLLLLGALALMGVGPPAAWAPSTSVAPSAAPSVHQTPHLQAAASSSDLRIPLGHFPAVEEMQTTREAEIDDASGPFHLSPSATGLALASPEQIRPVHRARALLRRACVVLCVFLC